ncbi:hypothetical protein WJ438_19540 [Streptomyces sp. GD-15H]|uniref:hypothetical protein n=1 Tax=Streptomyces sp. GD-15H TaxID=3129112 RepID=UPI003245288C
MGGTGGTALVLGGGGPVGGAWLTGVLAGLAEAGADIDGGTRSTGSLQLARGDEWVLAATPIPSAVGPRPDAWRQAAGGRRPISGPGAPRSPSSRRTPRPAAPRAAI